MSETQQHTPSAVAQRIAKRIGSMFAFSTDGTRSITARIVDEELAAHGALDLREGVFRCRHCGNHNPLPNSLWEQVRKLVSAALMAEQELMFGGDWDTAKAILHKALQPFKGVK